MPTRSIQHDGLSPIAVAVRLPGRPYRVACWLNLDVVAGTIAGGAFAVALCDVTPPIAWWWVLAAATWVVYTADRLADVRDPSRVPGFARHRFHRRHRRLLGLLAAALALCCGVLAMLALPAGALAVGGVVALAAGLQLRAAQRERPPVSKELLAATVYVAGIWCVPLLLASTADPTAMVGLGLHGLAALSNLVAFSIFELEGDRRDRRPSIARRLGREGAFRLLGGLAIAAALLAVAGLAVAGSRGALLATLVAAVVALVPVTLVAVGRCGRAVPYRELGDGAFVLLGVVRWLV